VVCCPEKIMAVHSTQRARRNAVRGPNSSVCRKHGQAGRAIATMPGRLTTERLRVDPRTRFSIQSRADARAYARPSGSYPQNGCYVRIAGNTATASIPAFVALVSSARNPAPPAQKAPPIRGRTSSLPTKPAGKAISSRRDGQKPRADSRPGCRKLVRNRLNRLLAAG
jgi:hypothetical protein